MSYVKSSVLCLLVELDLPCILCSLSYLGTSLIACNRPLALLGLWNRMILTFVRWCICLGLLIHGFEIFSSLVRIIKVALMHFLICIRFRRVLLDMAMTYSAGLCTAPLWCCWAINLRLLEHIIDHVFWISGISHLSLVRNLASLVFTSTWVF